MSSREKHEVGVRPVLVGVDGDARSAGALHYAIGEAVQRHAPLRVVHVTPVVSSAGVTVPILADQLAREAALLLAGVRDLVLRTAPVVRLATEVVPGALAEVLSRLGGTARLVVVGHEGKNPVERLVTGATTAAIAARASTPVAVVPAEWAPAASQGGRVVVGLRGPAHTAELLHTAFERAEVEGRAVHVVHVWKLPDSYADLSELRSELEVWEQGGPRMVEAELAPWRGAYPRVPVQVSVVRGDPAAVLTDVAGPSDLLVLVRRSYRLRVPHLGRVGRAVLAGARCPVLIVPPTQVAVAAVPDLSLEQTGSMLR